MSESEPVKNASADAANPGPEPKAHQTGSVTGEPQPAIHAAGEGPIQNKADATPGGIDPKDLARTGKDSGQGEKKKGEKLDLATAMARLTNIRQELHKKVDAVFDLLRKGVPAIIEAGRLFEEANKLLRDFNKQWPGKAVTWPEFCADYRVKVRTVDRWRAASVAYDQHSHQLTSEELATFTIVDYAEYPHGHTKARKVKNRVISATGGRKTTPATSTTQDEQVKGVSQIKDEPVKIDEQRALTDPDYAAGLKAGEIIFGEMTGQPAAKTTPVTPTPTPEPITTDAPAPEPVITEGKVMTKADIERVVELLKQADKILALPQPTHRPDGQLYTRPKLLAQAVASAVKGIYDMQTYYLPRVVKELPA